MFTVRIAAAASDPAQPGVVIMLGVLLDTGKVPLDFATNAHELAPPRVRSDR